MFNYIIFEKARHYEGRSPEVITCPHIRDCFVVFTTCPVKCYRQSA